MLNKTKFKRTVLIYLVSEYLLSNYHVAGIALVLEDIPVNKTDTVSEHIELKFKFHRELF